MTRVVNFSAGPAALPESVLETVQEELLDWHGRGFSVLEMPHRADDFEQIASQAEQDLRDLLAIPDDYAVLFLSGGGRSQFAMVPMNLAAQQPVMAYMDTGAWSHMAVEEAHRFGQVRVIADGQSSRYTTIPERSTWLAEPHAAYLHYTDNETIHGVEFTQPPVYGDVPLVTDMSSNLLSKPLTIRDYGLIYACAQKNLGPAGITVVIINKALLEREPLAHTPSMYRYRLHHEQKSFLNTPPTFPWYVMGLVFKWVKAQGGVAAMAELAQQRSSRLYQAIDQSQLYKNPVDIAYRSRMNVPFVLADSRLESVFLNEATQAGLVNLKGHRSVGGMRASLYNAMPLSGVDALIAFMRDFEQRH